MASTSRISRLTVGTVSFSRRTLIHAIASHSRVSSKDKGKGHRRTGHEGPDEEQMYSSTLSLISALDGVVNATTRPL